MEFAEQYNGAVFFVDILGIGALTQGKISLDDDDFVAWEKKYPIENKTNQFLAAVLLSQFRKVLNKLWKKFKDTVQVTQLSDCAFIWSKNVDDVVIFANNFMSEIIKAGVLCRGGLSYGEIIETSQENERLGRFIVGKAVTDAVRAESSAKGCRIITTFEFSRYFVSSDTELSKQIYSLMKPMYNKVDFSIRDEFKWYYWPNLSLDIKHKSREDLTKERLSLAAILKYSLLYNWNTKNSEGLNQLDGSISILTENDSKFSYEDRVFGVNHDYDWNQQSSSYSIRCDENVSKVISMIKKSLI